MKIGFVIGSIADGGLERRTVNLVNEFSSRDHHEVVLLTGPKKNEEYDLLPVVKRVQLLKGSLIKDVFQIKTYAQRNRVDLLIGMGIYASFLVCMVRCISKLKTVVVEANDPRHDHISAKSRILRKLLYWKSDGFVFQTEEERSFYSKRIQSRSVVIHNPVKSDLPDRENGTHKKEIVAVGRFMPQKNYGMLIDAFHLVHARYPEYRLHIFGKGAEEKSIQEQINRLHLEDFVAIKGFSLNVHEEIKQADIYVLSSDFEGMPNALLEAMSMGFPVISTACGGGGPQEVIVDDVNGVLVPANNAEALAEKIIWMIENPEQKERLGQAAKGIRESHSLDTIVKQWDLYFCQLIGG